MAGIHVYIVGGRFDNSTSFCTTACQPPGVALDAIRWRILRAIRPCWLRLRVLHVLPPSRNIKSWRVQTQETTVRGNDFYTPHFTLPTNSPPTHQPHSILSYPSRTLYFDTKFEPSRTLYFGTEGVHEQGIFSLFYLSFPKTSLQWLDQLHMDQVSWACVQSINCSMTTVPTPGPFRTAKKNNLRYCR
jgi:hypothetical protein